MSASGHPRLRRSKPGDRACPLSSPKRPNLCDAAKCRSVPDSCTAANSISIRSMLAVVPGVSNSIQTRVGHSARSFREGAPRSAKEEYSHEGLVSHRSAVRSRDLRNDPDLSASNAAWSRTERRWGEGHHLWARAACKPSSGTSRIPSNPACCSSRRLLGRAFSAASLLADLYGRFRG